MNENEMWPCDLLTCFCRSAAMVLETHPIDDVQEISRRNEDHAEYSKIHLETSADHVG